jgi:hypothetical protein
VSDPIYEPFFVQPFGIDDPPNTISNGRWTPIPFDFNVPEGRSASAERFRIGRQLNTGARIDGNHPVDPPLVNAEVVLGRIDTSDTLPAFASSNAGLPSLSDFPDPWDMGTEIGDILGWLQNNS